MLFRSGLGQRGWIAFFFLISPAFLFFGRSGIHEMPFVFFQVVFALGLLRWGEERDEKALELALFGLFGMMTLKETFVLALASWGVGAIFLGPKEWRSQFSWAHLRQTWTKSTTWLLIVLLIIFVGLFTGFGRNPRGVWSFVEAFLPWMKTGVGENGHNKEFWYWLKVTWTAEPLAVLGMVLAVWGLLAKESALRLVSVFSLCQFLLYSAIPYKTVWCIITLLWGFYFVLAMSIVKYWNRRGWQRWLLPVFVVLVLPLQFKSDYESVYKEPINMDHPYVYVNTTYEQKAIQDLILLKLQDPAFAKETVQMGMEEQWPWPWVFRNAVTSWHHCGQYVSPDALVYFCDPKDSFFIENQLKQPYLKRSFQMRQARGPSLVYLRKNVFDGTATGDYEVVGPETKQEH